MEQTRLFIAIGISFGIFFLWSMFFAPTPPQAPSEDVQEQGQVQPSAEEKAPAEKPEMAAPAPVVVAPTHTARKITVDAPLYRIVLSEQGGTVVSMVLKKYREALPEDAPLKELITPETTGGSVLTHLSGMGDPGIETAVFTSDQTADQIDIQDKSGSLKFQHRTASGLIIEKTYTFDPASYLIDLKVTLYNDGDHPYQGKLALGLQNKPAEAGFGLPCHCPQ